MPQSTNPAAKLRVLVAGHLPPPMGGIATYFQTLMASSLPQKVNLRFVQTSSQTRDFATSGSASWANATSALRDILRFTRAALSHRPQVSHIATAFGLSFVKHSVCVLAARVVGSRVLLHPHCSLSALYTDRPTWWKWYFRQVIRLTDGVIALSEEWNQLAEIVPGKQVYALVNAVNLDLYANVAQAHLAQDRPSGEANVLYLGYLGKAKGTFDLIEAAKLVLGRRSDVVFDLVGGELTPGEKAQVEHAAAETHLAAGLHVNPPAYDEQKLDFLSQADIFVYPSYYEGMPMAVLEAMACALPVIATRTGGLPDLVKEGINGLLVEPGKPEELAGALQILLDDENTRRKMAAASYQIANDCYGIEQHVDKLLAAYTASVKK